MSMPCPPAPNYVREQGIADCDYLQETPFVRRDMRKRHDADRHAQYDPNMNQTYSIGGYPMRHSHMGAAPRIFGTHGHHMGAAPRVFGTHGHHMGAAPRVFGLGRSLLDVSAAASFNSGSNAVRPTDVGIYGNTSSEAFIRDLWTAQVIALWVTDGKMYKRYQGMEGIITRNGLNPMDFSPLQIGADGVAMTDLRGILNPSGNRDAFYVKGPDGMFGPSAESLIEEYAGTGKIFGKSLPESSDVKIALDRLASRVKTPKIDAARAKAASNNPPPPRDEPVATPCHMLQPAARAARADCPPLNGGGGGGGSTPPGGNDKGDTKGEKSTAAAWYTSGLFLGGAAALLLGVTYYYVDPFNNRKDTSKEI